MAERAAADPGDLEQLLEYVQRTREFDFSGYKRPTLGRRISKRMSEVDCENYAQYQDYLEVHPDEFVSFFDAILINVTSFFRDPQAWEFVADEIVPGIVSGSRPDDPIRIWSAGCASGEEAYTLAIVLCEALGPEQFRKRVKVYGTDIDEAALVQARQATYNEKAMDALPEEYRDRYFERNDRGFAFRGDLRRSVIFGRHDLMKDAPISRLDLLSCRNTLMYFNADAQAAILDRFRFALEGGGYLFLGRAETLLTHSAVFRPLQLKLRIFQSAHTADRRRQNQQQMRPGEWGETEWPRAKLRDAAFDAAGPATMVIDAEGAVQSVNAAGRSLFAVTAAHLGEPLQDLEISYRPIELRSLIDEAYQVHDRIERRGIVWPHHGDHSLTYDVAVTPLYDHPSGTATGVSISFEDVTRYRVLEAELEQSTQELQTAYEELQSTNEELETMNEELQSTNDEFHVVNEMLDARGQELDHANVYLQSVLTGIRSGVVVVDPDLVVQIWNHWSEDLWGLRAVEVEGKHLVNLDIGLPITDVLPEVRSALEGDEDVPPLELPARNRRGRDFTCVVRTSPVVAGGSVIGAVVLMSDTDGV